MRVTILGCGASSGVPVIGCDCAVCTSENPKNRRSRVSILVEYASGTKVLVDTSPDLREQSLCNNINSIDAIIYTHAHADHTHGIDDVRPFNIGRNAEIDAYGTAETLAELQQRFGYVWQPYEGGYWTRAALKAHVAEAGADIVLASGEVIQTFAQTHGKGETLGLRFGGLVYSTDVNAFDEAAQSKLQNMDIWIVDCLRDGFAGSHANLEMAVAWSQQFKPKQTYLTHMNHELDYDVLMAKLPKNIEPAFDGLSVTLPDYS